MTATAPMMIHEIIRQTEMSSAVKLIGSLLGSRFTGFTSPFNVQGLADIQADRVDFLAIYTDHRGDGRFTAMLAALKEATEEIGIYAVTNARFGKYLERNGFTVSVESEGPDRVKVHRWRKET